MNSEELELSLRTEFESHLRDVLADMRQEFSQFQEKFQAEFDKHKSQLDTVFQDFSARLETSKELDLGFKETVVEHLRLARDEGARITATAIAEAEEMQRQNAPTELLPAPPTAAVSTVPAAPAVGMSELRDAIKDITAQDSQGTILKSLVQHAMQFTPRGAFFIIKNERFVGWRVFNKEGEANEDAVREINLLVASDSVLGEAVRSLSAVESSFGTYSEDAAYLNQIEFGEPERMFAIPLVVRGRGVAVLYADHGTEGEQVSVEALETLVRVAGLTVEMLASASQAVKYTQSAAVPATVQPEAPTEEAQQPEEHKQTGDFQQTEEHQDDVQQTKEHQPEEYQQAEKAQQPDDSTAVSEPVETLSETAVQPEETESSDDEDEAVQDAQEISVEPAQELEESVTAEVEEQDDSQSSYSAPPSTAFRFSEPEKTEELPTEEFKTPQFDSNTFEPTETFSAKTETFSAKDDFAGAFETSNGSTATYAPEPAAAVVEPVAAPVRSRFSDRNVDLPIEVSEDERRLHNDARRFARLLVSEIKLYNEQKVKEGRAAQDLYDRLREAIDRSRDMYDKRVQPPVAAKFDYFHYELVSTLAEGEPTKLGGDYPGAAV